MLQQIDSRGLEEHSDKVTVSLRSWTTNSEKFSLGEVAVCGLAAAVMDTEELGLALSRHVVGDWGIVSDVEKVINDCCLQHGGSVRSAFLCVTGDTITITTDAVRQTTTVTLETDA